MEPLNFAFCSNFHMPEAGASPWKMPKFDSVPLVRQTRFIAYHDDEWGRPERDPRLVRATDPRKLSGRPVLDHHPAQARGFRAAFQGFDPDTLATWGEPEVTRLLADPGIVRHRGKIEGHDPRRPGLSADRGGQGFSPFLWSFVAASRRL
jgi:DNA-3-methyladenine glycosylase I